MNNCVFFGSLLSISKLKSELRAVLSFFGKLVLKVKELRLNLFNLFSQLRILLKLILDLVVGQLVIPFKLV